jgi:hypothetical protein
MNMQDSNTTGEAMTAVAKPARWLGRVLSGLVILFLLFDGAIKLMVWGRLWLRDRNVRTLMPWRR